MNRPFVDTALKIIYYCSYIIGVIGLTSSCPYNIKNFNKSSISKFSSIGGNLGLQLEWFSRSVTLFTFPGHDGLLLQGYYIPSPTVTIGDDKPIIVFVAGWSETTLKYATFLHTMHDKGYTIYSFDMRGQGFSSTTGYDKGRVSYIESFSDYVDDLNQFVKSHVLKGRTTCEGVDYDTELNCSVKLQQNEIVYIANSMAALVGLTLQARNPNTFSRMALMAPGIRPTGINLLVRTVVSAARRLGLGKKLLSRLKRDISDLKLTHSLANAQDWIRLRDLVPENLVIEGPSVSFFSEFIKASDSILKMGHKIGKSTKLLIFQAGIDIFVENEEMDRFFASLNTTSARMVRFGSAYHELLVEEKEISDKVVYEVLKFLEE